MSSLFSKPIRLATFLSLLVLLGACSSTTFIYNRLDFLLPWYVEDYTSLNGEQEDYLDGLLAPFLAWHRAQELPRYLDTLNRIEAGLDEPWTAEQVGAIWRDFEAAWFRLEAQSLEWLLDLGGQLSDKQMADFLEELWEQQEDFEKKYLKRSDEEFVEESYDSLRDSAQDYLGKLDKAQRKMLRDASGALRRSDEHWLNERADWLRQLQVMLQREPGWQQRVLDAVAARNDTVSVQYIEVYEHNLAVIQEVIAELLNTRFEKQDRHLRRKLNALQADLETLVRQGEAKGALIQ